MHQVKNISPLPSSIILRQCEAIIEEELKSLTKLARALEVIEQMKLYTEQYDDFESYCKNRWKTIEGLDNQGSLKFNLIKKDKK